MSLAKLAYSISFKQKKFAELYVGEACGDVKSAAISAGYAKGSAQQTGYKNLENPRVRAYIDALRDYVAQTEPDLVGINETREYMLAIANGNIAGLDDSVSRMKALDMYAKSGAMYAERRINENHDMNSLTEKELADRINDLEKALESEKSK